MITEISLYLIKFAKDKLDFFNIQYTCNIIANPWLIIRMFIILNVKKLCFTLIKVLNPLDISNNDFMYELVNKILTKLQISIDDSIDNNSVGNVLIISKYVNKSDWLEVEECLTSEGLKFLE